MSPKQKMKPTRRKRLALRATPSPRASAPGAAETGEAQPSLVGRQASRFLDWFWRRSILAALALGLLAGVCYLPAMLWGGLIWDDFIWFQSRAVLEWSGLGTIWSWPPSIEREAHYWPLTYTTFWLEHKIWGLEPFGYHVVNVLLHLFNTLLVWRLLLRLAVPGAWIAAAVFAVHPTHVESVAWIIERKDVLSGLFYLAALLVWLRFLEQPPTLALRPGSAAVRGRPAEQIHRVDPASGLADPAVVEERPHHRAGSVAGGALLAGGAASSRQSISPHTAQGTVCWNTR